MENLANTYHNQRRWNEAEKLEVQVMDMRKKLFGAEHPHTLFSMGNLARIYHNQGKWNKAEQLEVQVMNMRKMLLGARHPDTLLSMGNLSSTYHNHGRQNEAKMDMSKRLLDSEHPDSLLGMRNLANPFYIPETRWNEAEATEQLNFGVMPDFSLLSHNLSAVAEHPGTLTSFGTLGIEQAHTGHHKDR